MAPIKQSPPETSEAETKPPETTPPAPEKPPAGSGGSSASPPALEAGSGELVPPSDPRAAEELDAMLAQIVGAEPSAQEILQAIVGGEDLPEASAQQSQSGIVARILGAAGADAVLDMGEPVKAEELEQIPLLVKGVRWMRSTFDEGPGVYAVADAVRIDNEEQVKVTCGGVNVMTQLLKLQTMGVLPQKVKIVKASRPTKSGYYPYWLQPA
jgi:hypothetical protein